MPKITKLINTKKSKYFWAYIVVGALLMIASIMFMPFWKSVAPDLFFASWGEKFVKIVISCVLFIYLIAYLLKKLVNTKIKAVKILSIIEFVALSLIALSCIISQFATFYLEVSLILALAVWMRGAVELVRAYCYDKAIEKYPVYKLIIAILLATFGGYLFATKVITAQMILWTATIIALIFSIVIFVLGFYKNPNPPKKKK